jgi:hypothetical protein
MSPAPRTPASRSTRPSCGVPGRLVGILVDALLQCASREEIEYGLDQWFAKRLG